MVIGGWRIMWSVSHRSILNDLCLSSNLPFSFRATAVPLNSLKLSSRLLRMEKSEEAMNIENKTRDIKELIHADPKGGWDKCWEQGLTPWDLKQPAPVILHLHQTDALPRGRALVPGCGTGYDVVAIASPDRYVVGLDISDHAVKKAKELFSSLPNANYFTFSTADFFTWQPTELFDLIYDYTFFCAIEPSMRPAWASQIQDLLKPDGELITLMFPISDHVGGPPYKVSVADYEDVLHPLGFKAISIVDNELAIGPRMDVKCTALDRGCQEAVCEGIQGLEIRTDGASIVDWLQEGPSPKRP